MDPDSVSLEFGIDIQAAVAERLAQKNKKTVQLNDLLKDTKFTKSEIRTMYRGFKQVSLLRLFNLHISFSLLTKGQLISKCLYEIIVWTKIPTKILIVSALALSGQKLSNFLLVFWSKRRLQKDILKLSDL